MGYFNRTARLGSIGYFQLSKLAKFHSALLGFLVAVWPALIAAEDIDASEVSQEFSSLLTHRNNSTEVELNQCSLAIHTRVRNSCSYPSEPNWQKTTIDLREVKEIELRPFNHGFVLDIEFDVPTPSLIQTLAVRQLKGEQAAFDFHRAEADRLLKEHELVSNETLISCTGKISKQPKSRSLLLFLDSKPRTWHEFEKIVQNCN